MNYKYRLGLLLLAVGTFAIAQNRQRIVAGGGSDACTNLNCVVTSLVSDAGVTATNGNGTFDSVTLAGQLKSGPAALDGGMTITSTITSSVASGSNAMALGTGARIDVGAGANDYLYSDGNGVITASSFQATSFFAGNSGYSLAGTAIIGDKGSFTVGLNGYQQDSASRVAIKVSNPTTLTLESEGIMGWYPDNFTTLVARVTPSGKYAMQATDSSGTPGAATINKPSGQSSIAAAAASVVITNSIVSSTSIIFAVLQTSDTVCVSIKSVVPGSGTFTINTNGTCNATTNVGWVVFN